MVARAGASASTHASGASLSGASAGASLDLRRSDPAGPRCDDALAALNIAASTYYYKPMATFFGAYELRAYQTAALKLDGPVLDVGCSDGSMYAMLTQLIGSEQRAIGVDINEAFLAQARTSHGRRYRKLMYGDAQALPFADRSFQTIIANGLIVAVPDPGRAAAEISRVLQRSGTAYITVPTHLWPQRYIFSRPLRALGFKNLEQRYSDGLARRMANYNCLEPRQWFTLLRDAGLRVRRVVGFFPESLVGTWSLLATNALRSHSLLRIGPLQAARKPAAAFQRAAFARRFLATPRDTDAQQCAYILIEAVR